MWFARLPPTLRLCLLISFTLLGCAGQPAHEPKGASEETKNVTTAMQSKVTGAGAPLVLVGGGLPGWLSWDPHAETLSASRKVVRLQPLNVQWGLEDRPMPADYSVKTEGHAIAAALDAVGITVPVDIVGWSYGGLATLDFALDNPKRIRTVTLSEPPAMWVLREVGPMDDEARRNEAALGKLHGKGKATGKSVRAAVTHVLEISDGKIVRFDQYVDSATINPILNA